MQSKF